VALFILAIGSIAGMVVGSGAQAETQYTPSVSLGQRYDSNVFGTATVFVPQGSQAWDLVSTVGTKLELLNKSRLGNTALRAGVDGNVYAYNTNLSYASTNVLASSDVTEWAHELLPGLKLRISDRFIYTPQQSAFMGTGVRPISGAAAPPNETDVFARGIQGARANTLSNYFLVEGGYSFSRSVGLRANYNNSILHVGRVYVNQAATAALNYYDTTVNNVAGGPTYTFSDGDTLFLKFGYLNAHQTNAAGITPAIHFTSESVQTEYVTKIVRDWTATISGGASIVEQVGNRTFATGGFSLRNDFDRQTQVEIAVSRQVAPAYIGIGGAMISNVAGFYVSHGFSRVVQLSVTGNIAHNESAPVHSFTIDTIRGVAVLDYKLTRSSKLSLSQEYGHFEITGIPTYDRYVTMLMVNTEWH
jgi:hypothetical protein